jgi:hypothetical protein
MSVVSDVIMAGLASALPSASSSNDGYLYFETDTGIMKRSNGSSWVTVSAGPAAGIFIKADGSVAFSGDQSMGGNQLTNVGDPGAAQDAATKAYVDGIAANLGKRARVRAATTANITIATALNNADTLDGVTLATGDLVLVKDQSSAAENGVYEVGVSPARATEFDTYNEHPGSLIAVQEGTTNADTIWLCTSNVGGILNTTAINFSSLGTGNVDDTAYDATTWNGDTTHAPSKNAMRDKIESMSAGSGALVQKKGTMLGTVATGTTTTPIDNTIPQNTEGDQYLTQAITPTDASNILFISVVLFVSHTAANSWLIGALFQDTTANALAAMPILSETANGNRILTFTHKMVAGTTSPTTFKVRVGANQAGTTTINGTNSNQFMGGVMASSIVIEEVIP